MASLHFFVAVILLTQGFTLFATSALGRHLMSQQDTIDGLVSALQRAKVEILQRLTELQGQIDAGVPAEQLDLGPLTEITQALDDVVPDAPVDVPTDEPA